MHARILSIDYGRVRIGLAVSDGLGMASHPLPALQRSSSERDLAALRRVAESRDVQRLVVGLPLNMDGSEGPMAAEVRAWAVRLAEELALPLEMEDERLTTDEAEAFLKESGLRPSDRKKFRDSVAAALILRSVLEREGS
jgi:putative Holliday junction resolvase